MSISFIHFKKGELQIMETIMVVIIIIVMILIGMVFFYRFTDASISEQISEYQKQDFDNFIFTFPQFAEVGCSEAGYKSSCLDNLKLIGFSENVIKNKEYYQGIFGNANITLKVVYPIKQNTVCTRQNLDDCSIYPLYYNLPKMAGKSKRITSTPVSIYLANEKKYAIGVLTITGYNIG